MVYDQRREMNIELGCDRGMDGIFSLALLLVLVLAQNPDWGSSSLLWWGSIAFLSMAFFIGCRGWLYLEGNYSLWLFAFLGICFFSFFWAIQPALVLTSLKNMVVHLVILIFIRSLIRTEQGINRVLLLLLVSVVINVIWLLYSNAELFETMGGSAEVLDRLGSEGNWNANVIGMMAAIAMLVSLYFQKNIRNVYVKLLLFLVVALMIFVTFLSGSRKALLMVLMGFCGFVFVSSKGKRLRALIIIAGMVLLLYYLVMEVPFFHSIIGWRIEGFISSFTGVGSVDESTAVREKFVKDALRVWQENPLIGVGLDCYRNVNLVDLGIYAHNNYVELLADIGILGTVVYYSSYLYCFLNLIKPRKKDLQTWLLLVMLLIMTVIDYGFVSYNSFLNKILLMLMFSKISLQRQQGAGLKVKLW